MKSVKKICICVLVILAIYPKALAFGSWNLGPWDGYMTNIAVGSVGDFMRVTEAPDINKEEASPVITSSTFHIDSSFKQFLANIRVANPFSRDLEIVLIAPSGEERPVRMNWCDRGLTGHTTDHIDLDPSSPGAWRIECRGVSDNEAQMTYRIIGVSRGLRSEDDEISGISTTRPYRGAIFANIEVLHVRGTYNKAHGGELFVVVETNEGWHHLTNLSVNVTVRHPDGSSERIAMNDNGVWPDSMARDGVYTGILRLRPNLRGQVSLTAEVSNPAGRAIPTYIMELHRIEGWQFWGERITEPFYRLAHTSFYVTGDLPDNPMPLPRYDTIEQRVANVIIRTIFSLFAW